MDCLLSTKSFLHFNLELNWFRCAGEELYRCETKTDISRFNGSFLEKGVGASGKISTLQVQTQKIISSESKGVSANFWPQIRRSLLKMSSNPISMFESRLVILIFNFFLNFLIQYDPCPYLNRFSEALAKPVKKWEAFATMEGLKNIEFSPSVNNFFFHFVRKALKVSLESLIHSLFKIQA